MSRAFFARRTRFRRKILSVFVLAVVNPNLKHYEYSAILIEIKYLKIN